MKELNTMDNLFKDAFDGLTVAPEASVKSAIDAQLFAKSGKRRAGFWLFLVGIGMGTAALFAGIYSASSTHQNDSLIGIQRLAFNHAHMRTTMDAPSKILAIVSDSTETIEHDSQVSNSNNQSATSHSQINADLSNRLATSHNGSQVSGNARESIHQSQFGDDALPATRIETDQLVANKDEVLAIGRLIPRKLGMIESDLRADLIIDPNWKEPLSTNQANNESGSRAHSFTAFVNYGFESTNSNREQVDYNRLENAQIQLRTAAFKVEYKKSFTSVFGWNVGLGYADHSLLQKGRITTWDSVITQSTISTLTPELVYDPTYYSATTRFRFQQFQLGLGMTFSYSLLQNCNLDVSLGSDFSLGKLTQLDTTTFFESPAFSNFGLSLYLRPAIEYKLENYSFLVFGQVNQSLVSHLQWSFLDRRNPAFGAGIACRYYF